MTTNGSKNSSSSTTTTSSTDALAREYVMADMASAAATDATSATDSSVSRTQPAKISDQVTLAGRSVREFFTDLEMSIIDWTFSNTGSGSVLGMYKNNAFTIYKLQIEPDAGRWAIKLNGNTLGGSFPTLQEAIEAVEDSLPVINEYDPIEHHSEFDIKRISQLATYQGIRITEGKSPEDPVENVLDTLYEMRVNTSSKNLRELARILQLVYVKALESSSSAEVSELIERKIKESF